ncbi:MAG: hypothetical protein GX020_03115 [Firmicutes bacterium]|nr:hypothetical protein [Bacillota bacterium]
MTDKYPEFLSLLWPHGVDRKDSVYKITEYDHIVKDLELEKLAGLLTTNRAYPIHLSSLLEKFSSDPKVLSYRLDIVEDFMSNSSINGIFNELLSLISELENISRTRGDYESEVDPLIYRIGELDVYYQCIELLRKVLDQSVNSEGLLALRSHILSIVESDEYISLGDELPKMREILNKCQSLTIGVNLDAQLRPKEAVLVSINDQEYTQGSLLDRLLNIQPKTDGFKGISPLQVIAKGSGPEVEQENAILRQAILQAIKKTVRSVLRPVTPMIRRYIRLNGDFLFALAPEIAYYLGLVKLINTLKAEGLPVCKPEPLAMSARVFVVKDIYSVNLALQRKTKRKIVVNDISFDENGRIFILTGPNQGGKTTFVQAIGLAQFLFQLGSYVPGSEAKISPVDRIFSHFPVREKPESNLGRMGEECARVSEIFEQGSMHSLVLLNETLSSTSPQEGMYIAKGIVSGLRLMGARAIYATHFHELASDLDNINNSVQGSSKVESLVAGIDPTRTAEGGFSERTFKIIVGPPEGLSYAREIARKYGVSVEQIKDRLEERGVLNLS